MENDKMARLEEIIESMESTIDNISIVYDQQGVLLNLVETSDKKEMFEGFIKDMKEQLANLADQKLTLCIRQDLLHEIIDECKNNEYAKDLLEKVFKAFGIFEEK